MFCPNEVVILTTNGEPVLSEAEGKNPYDFRALIEA
jgi:hypothetical protein